MRPPGAPTSKPAAGLHAFFATPDMGGQRLCLHHLPQGGSTRAAVLHVHAFGEEMNKSRRMVTNTARALAAQGCAVLQIDLLGCGDSSGDLADASWDAWLSDVAWAAHWLQRTHDAPLWLWGHRAGALLTSAAAAHTGITCHFLHWQPIASGKSVLQSFLRMKAAAEWSGGDGKAAANLAKADMAAGEPVEIAGYVFVPGLVRGLEAATLAPPPQAAIDGKSRVVWLEVSGGGGDEPTLSVAGQAQSARWRSAGYDVDALVVAGPPFWQTVEIEDAPALTAATLAALCDRAPIAQPLVGPSAP